MNTLNWLFKPSNKPKAKDIEGPIATEELLSKIREEHFRLATVEEQCHFRQLQIDMQNGYLEKANKEAGHNKTQLVVLEQKVTELSSYNVDIHHQLANLKNEAKKNDKKAKTRDTKIADLEASLIRAHTNLHEALVEIEKLRRRKQDLQFDLELLRCTAAPPDTKHLEIVPQPFVLVLVDGDAYAWSPNHFNQQKYPPGAHAAQAIKNEVQQYLLANKERIPLQCRIVTRVYQNLVGRISANKRPASKGFDRTLDFAKTFTESMPLFDFFNAGEGKERADEKIKETFHLFISNPYCHTIFLAAAKDNGFARLLEQYACIETARARIVIVHVGYIIHEISELGLAAVEWPNVFSRQAMPVAALERRNKFLTQAKKARDRLPADIVEILRGGMQPLRVLSSGHLGIWDQKAITSWVGEEAEAGGVPEREVTELKDERLSAGGGEEMD